MLIRQQRKRRNIDLGTGTLTVSTQKRRKTYAGRDNDEDREFIAKILFKSKATRSVLTISVRQAEKIYGAVTSIPTLFASNVLQNGSEVFKLAANGDLKELKVRLARGEASLHDRDEDGLSLLHVSSTSYPGSDLCNLIRPEAWGKTCTHVPIPHLARARCR